MQKCPLKNEFVKAESLPVALWSTLVSPRCFCGVLRDHWHAGCVLRFSAFSRGEFSSLKRFSSGAKKHGEKGHRSGGPWSQFFADPSQWWDHRAHKVSPNYPDFKHKTTGLSLWIDRRSNPSWVKTELERMTPGSVSRSLYSWNSIISGCVKSGRRLDALKLYNQMQAEGVKPSSFTFATVLHACADLAALEAGKRVHAEVIQNGCESDIFVGSVLVDMYAKCGSMENAQEVFDKMPMREVVCWTALLAGYVKCEQGRKALELFALMKEEGVKPNSITFVVVLNACASTMALDVGRRVHTQLIENGCESDMIVGCTLVDMYAKCGSIEDAERVFHKMSTQDVVSWTAMLAGYVKCEQGEKALKLFTRMQEHGVKPDPVTFVVALNACASVIAIDEGRRIHAQLVKSGYQSNMFIASSLVDMYAKCGSIEDAQKVFGRMTTRDVVSWSSMLGGFAIHGQGREALQLFQEMCQAGVEMNMVTFVCLLSACSHGGLVDEGIQLFKSMEPVYGVSQTVEHCICMVDLLGRAGRLDEAESFIKNESKISENSVALITLLGACRNHGKVEMGERIAQKLLALDPNNHTLLSNIYSKAGYCSRYLAFRV